jgi:hypothetical protein
MGQCCLTLELKLENENTNLDRENQPKSIRKRKVSHVNESDLELATFI